MPLDSVALEWSYEQLEVAPTRPRFGLDLDGVCYRFDETMRFLMRSQFGYDLPPSQTWGSVEAAVSKKAWRWLWEEGVREHGLFRHGHLETGTVEALRSIKGHVDPVVITSRPKAAAWDTYEWLAFHRMPVTEVHITAGRPKSSVQPHCDTYLDDSPKVIQDLLDNTYAVVLIWDRPWNHDFFPKGNSHRWGRVFDWDDVVAHFKQEDSVE